MSRLPHTVRGLVLSRRNIREADRLVTLFTYEEGLWRLSARGVRMLSSRRGRHLEPMTEITAQIAGRGQQRELVAAETIEYFAALQRDDDALQRAQVVAGGMVALFGEQDAQPALYLMLRRLWQQLPVVPLLRRPMWEVAAVFALLAAAGITPQLERCRRCGYAGNKERAATLEPASGSVICEVCQPALSTAWHVSSLAWTAARVAAQRVEVAERCVVPAAAAGGVTAPWRAYLAWLR